VRHSNTTQKFSSNSKTKEFNPTDAFSPMLGRPTVFGDLEIVKETVACGYMQPTKAFTQKRQSKQ